MQVGMGIDPDHTQAFVGIGLFDTANGTGRCRVVTRQYNGKKLLLSKLLYLLANPLQHDKNTLTVFGIFKLWIGKKATVLIFDPDRFKASKKIGLFAQAGHFHGVYAQAGPPRVPAASSDLTSTNLIFLISGTKLDYFTKINGLPQADSTNGLTEKNKSRLAYD